MPWWLIGFFLVVYTLVCFFLIFVILIQSGKGGGLSSLAGASQQISDRLGNTSSERTITKMTTICAVSFMVLAIVLSIGVNSAARTTPLAPLGTLPQTSPGAAPLTGQQGLPTGAAVPPTAPAAGAPAAGAPVTAGAPAAVGTPPVARVVVGTPVVSNTPPPAGAAVAPAATPAR